MKEGVGRTFGVSIQVRSISHNLCGPLLEDPPPVFVFLV